jgi:uncharacterized protein
MRIAILSDTHDNIWRLDRALSRMGEADLLIHCGDLCSPFVAKHLGEGAPGRPIHIVWGNNDGDPRMILRVASSYPEIQIHGPFAELELGDLRIGVNHYPEIARPLAASGRYDLVCYGHDHTAHESRVGGCVLLNPGELMGLQGKATFAWFDTATREVRFQEVD